MNCTYPLWNLRERRCPECGEAFKPSDHHFTANAVRFSCPHCEQSYYGTGDRGHLVPNHFDCVTCGRAVSMDEMIVRPHDQHTEQYATVETLPWLRRSQEGTLRAWWRTGLLGIHAPNRIALAAPPQASGWGALWFMVLSIVVLMTIGYGVPALIFDLIIPAASGVPVTRANMTFAISGAVVSGVTLAIAVLWIPIAHGILRITGPVAHPMRRTTQAIGYTAGSGMLLAIPFCGMFLGWIWWSVSAGIAICAAQKVHWFRGLLAAVLPSIVGVGLPVVMWIVAVTSLLTMAGGQFQTGPMIAMLNAQAIVDIANTNNGAPPKHGIELLSPAVAGQVYLAPDPFLLDTSQTMAVDVPIGDGTLAEFRRSGPDRQAAMIAAAAASLPDDVVAHRVGDVVFTHHQIDVINSLPGLWLVVVLPDPDVPGNAPFQPNDQVMIGVLGRPVQHVPFSGLPRALEVQNKMRTSLGLPPLPDLTTVTHSTPARASDAP